MIDQIQSQYTRANKTIKMPLPDGNKAEIEITFYSYKDGYMSLKGTLKENKESVFILKAKKDEVYGFIHIFAEPMENGIVYRFESDNSGVVNVEKVPLSEIISISDAQGPIRTDAKPRTQEDAFNYRAEDLPNIPYIKPLPLSTNINELQSKPESDKVIWLDISEIMDGDEPIPYSRADMFELWQVVANGLSMYDVNVTTSLAVFTATDPQSRGIGYFYNREGRSSCAYKGFGTEYDCDIFLKTNGYFAGRTALHEYGHLLGVLDMGYGANGSQWNKYFPGYDDIKWVPIMGNFLYSDNWGEETLLQWSDGDFQAKFGAEGLPKEDQLSIIAGYVNRVPDDIPTSKSLKIVEGKVTMVDNYGMINVFESGFDEDEFTFEVVDGSSEVDLTIDRIGHIGGSMLDVHATLLDASGNVIVEDNQMVARDAKIKATVTPGTYTLRIAGGAEEFTSADFSDGGFTRYGSVGYYGIYGTIGNGVSTITTKVHEKKLNISSKNNVLYFADIPQNEALTVELFSLSGKRLLKKAVAGTMSVDLKNELSKGCYILQISGSNINHQERVTL